ncbi:hypothetical protein FRC00_013986 [Tulasnella sp. 408]|nr:hypothetical protein FRC00_013986 [Tulasnella sp. 408]
MLVWATLPDHPGIAKFLGFYSDFNASEAWLLSPWEPNGNVSDFIKAHDLAASEKLSLVYDTIDALAFLHQLDPPVCHGDLKSANVLVTAEYKARLCDFGLALMHEDDAFRALKTSAPPSSSIRWSSPELANEGLRSPASDVYAWAWLVWEIMTGELPHKEAKTDMAIMSEINLSPVPQLNEELLLKDFPQLWNLMIGCWNADPLLRPTARVCKFTVSFIPRSTISVHGSKDREPQKTENVDDETSATERNRHSLLFPSRTTSSQKTSSGTLMDQRSAHAQAVDEEYEKLERFRVDPRRIVFRDYQDQLGFGIVLRAELHESAYLPTWLASRLYGPPRFVAVKQTRITANAYVTRVKRAFTREMLVWSNVGEHPGIATFLGFYADFNRSEAWLLSSWEANGNVSEFVKEHTLEVPEKLSLICDAIEALNFLHNLTPPVCHGDIKSARLCDFGLARLNEDADFGRLETSTGRKGSIRWCSPELLEDGTRSPASDVYAWAWLVWEIMTGELPYEGTRADYVIIRKIFESPLPEVDGQSRLRDCLPVWELMRRCWNFDPGQRPTASTCKAVVTYAPRCTPAPANADHQTRSAALLVSLGDLESWKGNPEKSSAFLDEALRLCQKQADIWGVSTVIRKQALLAYRISDYVKLRAIATTALEYCRSLNDALGIAEASFYLGYSAQTLGKSDEALALLLESLEIRRSHEDDVGVVQCLEGIADVLRVKGQRRESLPILDQAVELASRSGDQVGLANVLNRVGVTHCDMSDFNKAAEALSEAIQISRDVGWNGGLSTTSHSMGRLKMRLNEYPEAEEHFRESVSVARRMGDRWRLAEGLEGLGLCYQRQSKLSEAASVLRESCLLWHELAQPWFSKEVASALVDLKTTQRNWDGVLFWSDHIISVCRSQNDHRGLANNLERKGEILVKMRRFDEGALHFEAAIAYRRENGSSWGRERRKLSTIPKAVMKWELPSPILCDLEKLQRRLPQLATAQLKLPFSPGHGEP